jgi:hypothetical protein
MRYEVFSNTPGQELPMARSVWGGCAILLLAVLVVGCGGKPEYKLVKDEIEVYNQMSAAYEKVKDRATFDTVQRDEIEPLQKKLGALEKELEALGPERKAAAMKENEAQFKEAFDRFVAVKKKAGVAAFGK